MYYDVQHMTSHISVCLIHVLNYKNNFDKGGGEDLMLVFVYSGRCYYFIKQFQNAKYSNTKEKRTKKNPKNN